jgi:sulfur-oxidizing protein SoxB
MRSLKTGQPIDPAKNYAVAGWASVNEGTDGPPIWDVVSSHIKRKQVVNIPENKNIRIVGG